jgi:hypothetical protein
MVKDARGFGAPEFDLSRNNMCHQISRPLRNNASTPLRKSMSSRWHWRMQHLHSPAPTCDRMTPIAVLWNCGSRSRPPSAPQPQPRAAQGRGWRQQTHVQAHLTG